ncbi:MAG: GGDEF domain-containing protein [Phycisphaerae bacterium]|nr:GGDEF domain-containing protein [Phycisphaerae bacterium]
MTGAPRSQPGDPHARHRRAIDLSTASGRRVILVGRTGLESVLRADADLEVTRVANTFDAIGELSSPIDRDSPRDAVVIVGPDADPALRASPAKGASGAGMTEAEEFVRGLRRIQPLVRVLRVAEPGMSGVPYDGVISPRCDAAAAKLAILGVADHGATSVAPRGRSDALSASGPSSSRSDAGGPGAVGVGDAALDTEIDAGLAHQPEGGKRASGPMGVPMSVPMGAAEHPVSGAMGGAGDEALVRAVLQGRDVLGPALELARTRTGDATLNVTGVVGGIVGGGMSDRGATPGAGSGLGVTLPNAAGSIEISDGVSIVGVLSGTRIDPAALRATGAWLSGWLKLARQQGELRRAAFTDALTGAWNRRYFERFLSAAVEQSARARHQLTVLVFDIDDFKRFNERYGHVAADEVLIEVVRLLTSVIRPSDRVCRIGGDEFAVVFYEPGGPRNPGSKHPSSVQEIAARFQAQIRQKRFPKLGLDAPGTLTISGGVSTFPWDGRSAEELLRHADLLALESKRQGKNAITLGPGGA